MCDQNPKIADENDRAKTPPHEAFPALPLQQVLKTRTETLSFLGRNRSSQARPESSRAATFACWRHGQENLVLQVRQPPNETQRPEDPGSCSTDRDKLPIRELTLTPKGGDLIDNASTTFELALASTPPSRRSVREELISQKLAPLIPLSDQETLMPDIQTRQAKKRRIHHFRPIFRQSKLPAMIADVPQTGLLALVDELLLSVIDQIDSRDALCSLAACCRRFQGLTEPYIWRSLLVTNGDRARSIAAALDVRETRSSYIQELSIRYPDSDRDGIQELNHFIVLMDKLRHLTIESPCPNNSEWKHDMEFDGWTKIDYTTLLEASVYPRKGIPHTLPMLQSLTLHGHGPDERKFVFGRCAVVFLHPTLKRITISCTNFDAKITHADITDQQKRSTPLKSLTLIECNVNVQFLDVVLSLPKALKELDIGERLHAFPGCFPSTDSTTRTSQPAFLKALVRQADSLERLSHISGATQYLPPEDPTSGGGSVRLSHLYNLRSLSLGIETMLLRHLQRDDYPASLRELKVMDVSWANNLKGVSEDTLRHPGRVLRRCTDVVKGMDRPVDLSIVFSNYNPEQILSTIPTANIALVLQSIIDGPLRTPMYTLSSLLRSSGRRLTLLASKFSTRQSYIPPYMYGEELPFEEKFYDSDDFWRVCGLNFRVMDDEVFVEEVKKKPRMVCTGCKDRMGRSECFNAGDGSMCIHCERDKRDSGIDGRDIECVYDVDAGAWPGEAE
ncbi:hypothetical protein P171DRAFT_448170 [Karstenula rhodostoma CBS 690.94]|uniref:F-box domain-containing protein n=1 Tax=Karstenula rhodostoma CBS 690.94 TaxID=1392251 RepID=A0A9P4P8H6_9PLEO|nr:hypothetical protein P171DRAFT_448170 [Karstenula rhodostoma CBS 690.94]